MATNTRLMIKLATAQAWLSGGAALFAIGIILMSIALVSVRVVNTLPTPQQIIYGPALFAGSYDFLYLGAAAVVIGVFIIFYGKWTLMKLA